MANVEKLSIALTPEMAGLVRRAVESGEYASTSEVVREALREWKQRRTLRQQDIEELRRLWEEGLASGPGRFEDVESIKAEARRRLQASGGEGKG
jgi:antitoxin ParD1/3/4